MPVKRLAAGRYQIRATDHKGKDVRRIINGPKTLAQELEDAIRHNRLRHTYGIPLDQPRKLLDDHWHDYLTRFQKGLASKRKPTAKTVQILKERYAHLAELHNLWLDEITREHLERCLSRGLSQDAAYKACALMKRLVRDAQERGIAVDRTVLATRVATPTRRDGRALSWAEVCELEAWMPEHVRRSVRFMALTGLRVGEMCAVSDADVFLKGGDWREGDEDPQPLRVETGPAEVGGRDAVPEALVAHQATSDGERVGGASYIIVRESKTDAGRGRRVYLSKRAAQLVPEQQMARPPGTSLLFPTSAGTPYTKDTYRRVLQRAATHADIGHITPHDLRRTAWTFLAQLGVDFSLAAEHMGWSPSQAAKMSQLYRRIAGWEMPRMVLLLDRLGEQEAQGEAADA